MDIRHDPSEPHGAFRASDDQGELGSMVYVKAGPKVILIQHTHVEDRAKGMGVGKALFAFMVDWARANEKKVSANCPFARRQFQDNPAARDVMR